MVCFRGDLIASKGDRFPGFCFNISRDNSVVIPSRLLLSACCVITPLPFLIGPASLPQILVAGFTVFKMQRSVSRLNVVGLVFALVGAVRYTIVSRREKKRRERRDAISSGSAKKAAQPPRGKGPAAPLLPVTAASTTAVKIPSSARGSSVMVNGKRTVGGDERKGGKVDGEKVKTKPWSWWSRNKSDASRRNR